MPPAPRPPRTLSAKGSRVGAEGARERGSAESSSAPPPRSRTTKADALRDQLARMYMMIGTMIKPFGRFYPVAEPIGDNLREFSKDAADAWMDLAQKDKKVLEVLETITGASTWGNVIGIHLAIFASALPGGGYISQVTSASPEPTGDPVRDEFYRQGKAAGLSNEEIDEVLANMQMGQMPVVDTGNGGPGDTIRTGGEPVAPTPSGIVSPEQLGVENMGETTPMPADTRPPNGSGTIDD